MLCYVIQCKCKTGLKWPNEQKSRVPWLNEYIVAETCNVTVNCVTEPIRMEMQAEGRGA